MKAVQVVNKTLHFLPVICTRQKHEISRSMTETKICAREDADQPAQPHSLINLRLVLDRQPRT